MTFTVKMGVPEIKTFWQTLRLKYKNNSISKNELKLFKLFYKATHLLSINPKHNSLNSHEINTLTIRFSKKTGYKCRVWQSYLQNNTPSAGRLYWCYGPGKNDISVIGLEPHPENKKDGYNKVKLSDIPPTTKP
jgi:hypothetical protein